MQASRIKAFVYVVICGYSRETVATEFQLRAPFLRGKDVK